MNTRSQAVVSGAIVGVAALIVGGYTLLGGGGEATANPAGHDHGAAAAAAGGARPVRLNAEAAGRIGVTYATAEPRPVRVTIQTVGSVTYDETRQALVNPKVEGWIERLYVDFTGAPVRRGQPLMEVYAPMLVAAQEELLLARRLVDQTAAAGGSEAAVAGARELLEAARRRLRFVDVAPAEIARIERSGTVRRTVTIRSPASGIVVEKTAVAGGRVMPGMDLFRIADLSTVWIDGQVFEKDMGAIRLGQRARVTFEAYPGEVFEAVVRFVHPSVAVESRTGRVRLALANPGGRLKPGMYARVELEAGAAREALVIPRSAVHTTGERSLVFVRRADGSLAHREVTLGRVTGTDVEVLSGLAAGEVVVASANFLIDAESSMGGAMGDMPATGTTGTTGTTGGGTPAPPAEPHAAHRGG
jgi:Cu(I)/Ag(I) efflux system membrane fusion protein